MTDWRKLAQSAATLGAIAAFLAFINPYGAAGSVGYPLSFAYWFALILIGGIGANLAMRLFARFWPEVPIWGPLAAAALASALVVCIFIIGFAVLFGGGYPIRYWARLYGFVLVIALGVTVTSYLVDRVQAGPPAAAPGEAADPTTRFLERLPLKYRAAQLYAIVSEDHYLRIHTSLGEELILMRLADAVRDLAGAKGLQVHRSWWVAADAVVDEKRSQGRTLLTLKSGIEVPVSRSYRAQAKQVGLLG